MTVSNEVVEFELDQLAEFLKQGTEVLEKEADNKIHYPSVDKFVAEIVHNTANKSFMRVGLNPEILSQILLMGPLGQELFIALSQVFWTGVKSQTGEKIFNPSECRCLLTGEH